MLPIAIALCFILVVPYLIYIILTRVIDPWASPAQKPIAADSEPEPVSIVLPTYNESQIIKNTLERLCSLSYPASKLEIVVVDSSSDGTADIVRSFFAERPDGTGPTLTLLEEDDRGGVARAVNLAIEAASHDIIFRTDCDSRLGDDVLEHAVANLQDPAVGAVTGRQTEVLGQSKVEENYRDIQAKNQALESHLDSTFIVHGPCFAFRREYFQPISTDSLADDTEIAVNIRKQGKRVVMDPEMRFAEVGVSDIRGRRQRKDRRAMGLLQLLGRHRDLLGRYGWYGRFVIPFNWFFLAISPWLLTAFLATVFLTLFLVLGPIGIVGPVALGIFIALGNWDLLGPLQPFYVVFDSQISLAIASVRLLSGDDDGTWELDADSRDVFERES
ncbi:glycosyltransferase [Natrialbaceae archaeon A-chndr2]